jgi:hypothetical protein
LFPTEEEASNRRRSLEKSITLPLARTVKVQQVSRMLISERGRKRETSRKGGILWRVELRKKTELGKR